MRKSTRSGRSRKLSKPKKPYRDFPLTAHATGKWYAIVNGKMRYFGTWAKRKEGELVREPEDGWREALKEYENDLKGRKPADDGVVTVGHLCNVFLTVKGRKRDVGELTQRSWLDYKSTTDRIVRVFGKDHPITELITSDFGRIRSEIAETHGPVSLGNEIQRVRTVFKFGFDEGLLKEPPRYGQQFKKPSQKVLRAAKQAKGPKMFQPEEIKKLIDKAYQPLKAMILLAINCGFGNSDCGTLPKSAVDLDSGWIEFPRPKTALPRRCPLWPETVEALCEAMAKRPKPKREEHDQLVFVTKYGHPWAKDVADSPISSQFRKLLNEVKLYRRGVGFYALRHSFRTSADETRDFPAIDLIMGHADHSMAARYRETISDERLRAVVDHVHGWVFGEAADKVEAADDERPTLTIVG